MEQPRKTRQDIEKENSQVRAQTLSVDAPTEHSKAPEKSSGSSKKKIRDNATFSWANVGFWHSEDTTDKKSLLELSNKIDTYVKDHFQGDWYWNCSLVIGTCFFSWLIARVGGGILSLGFILLFTNSVYRTEFRRFNRDIRDDMTRAQASNKLEDEFETMEWLNSFLDKFWVIYMPALSEQVMFQANEVLKDQAPGFGIEALSLDEFTLGSKAPRVESIKSYTRKGPDHIEMDWAFSFAPNDTDDMTKNEIKKKINPKVALGVTVGKAFISKSLPILVEDMSFKGRMNIKLKLTQNFPHVKMVSIQFLEPPAIDYVLKPVGGDTFGIDIMSFIPGLSSFVNGLIHANLRPMLYAPNSLDIDVEEILAQQSNDSIGSLTVNIKRCTGLKPIEKADVIHPYVEIKISNNGDICEKTKVKKDTNAPVFLESKNLLLNNLDSNHLIFNVYNLLKDEADDKLIGNVEIPLSDLLQKDVITGASKKIMEGGRVVGTIEYDLKWHPVLEPIVLEDGTKELNSDAQVGILKMNLHEAKDLDISRSVTGLLNPYAEIYINGDLVRTCRKVRQTNEPSWELTLEILLNEQSKTQVQIYIKDASDDILVAKLDANLQDILFESARGQEWIKCEPISPGAPPSKIRVTASWKALGVTGDEGATNFDAPVGGLKLHLRSATGIKNLEAVGNVDPYIRVRVNGKVKGRTKTIADTLNPNFNSGHFLAVSNEHQHILLELMDEEEDGKDRSLGTCAISVKDFLKKNDKGFFLGYDGANEIIEQDILYNGSEHGKLYYSVSFVPTMPVYTLAQINNKDKFLKSLEDKRVEEEERQKREEKLYKENPNKYEWVEINEDNLPEPERIEMPLEKVIKYRTGVIRAHISKGTFSKSDVYVHTLFDDHAFPSGVTNKSDGKSLDYASTAEAFIRDLPNSKLILRLSQKFEVNDEKDVVAEKIFDTIEVLKKSYNSPLSLKINEKNVVTVQLEFIPSAVKLAPLDTILDVGYLALDILSAKNLKSVDSNGKSDPFALVSYDGVQVYKTDKKRKTLDPVWNESVEIPMLSRSRGVILIEVFDWDLTHKPDLLGRVVLDLTTLQPFKSTQFSVPLDTQGELNMRATFKPEYIRPKLNSKGGLPVDLGAIANMPLKAVGSAAGFAGNAVGSGVGVAGNAVGSGVGFASDGLSKGSSFIKGFGRSKKKKSSGEQGYTSDDSDIGSQLSGQTGNTSRTDRGSSLMRNGKSRKNGGAEADRTTEIEEEPEPKEEEQGNSEENRENGESELRASAHQDNEGPGPEDNIKVKNEKHHDVNAAPNVDLDALPEPQKPNVGTVHYYNNDSDDRSFLSSVNGGGEVYPGRVAIVSASGFSASSLEVKTFIKAHNKEKTIFKTRTTKQDSNGEHHWGESLPFRGSPSNELVFNVRENHRFGKNVSVGVTSVPLSEVLNRTENIALATADGGKLVVNVKFSNKHL